MNKGRVLWLAGTRWDNLAGTEKRLVISAICVVVLPERSM